MGKLVVSLDGDVIKEVQITKDKTTLGRRPYNDIVIDNLAVSGEHAVLQMVGSDVFIEDLNSTNGTYINGKAVKKQLLAHNDTIEIGKYKIKFVHDGAVENFEKTTVINAGAVVGAVAGNAVERYGTREDALEILLQLTNGERRSVVQAKGDEVIKAGDKVILVTTGGKTRVMLAPR